jgi:hypothetical protein
MKRKPKMPDGKRAANAARQAEYRKRHLAPNAPLSAVRARLNLVVHPLAAAGLRRLAKHYGVTQVDMLMRLVEDAEHKATRGMSAKEQRAYYGDEDVTA